VKNAIDRTVVNSSKLPSTRQYTGSSWPGPPGFSRNGFKGIFFPRCTLEPASETKVSIVNNRDQSAKLLAQQTAKCPEYIGLAPGHFHGGSHFRVQSGLLHVLPYDPASRIYQTEFPVGATGKLRFRKLRIDSSVKSLQRIHSKAFASSQDTMEHFEVHATNVIDGPAPYSLVDLINSFPNLYDLGLVSLIDTIQDGSLSHLTNVGNLKLRVNAIKGSPFDKMKGLESISLTNGSLNHIPSNAFKIEQTEANTGKGLDIRFIGNPLNGSSFELGAFTHPSLNERKISLRFNNNNITFLNETVFLPFLQNENNKIELISGNPLDCDDCRTAWFCKKLSEITRGELLARIWCKNSYTHPLADCKKNFKKCK